MSTFVLVHGAWQSSATWDMLAPLLTQHGHSVVTPSLAGLGTDLRPLSPNISLSQHIQDVTAELSNSAEPVILVGHSYAGMIISAAAVTSPARIHRLVYMDAFIPEDGQCALDLLPPAIGAHFQNVASQQGNGWRLPGGEGQLDLWGLKPGPSRDFVRARLCDFSLRCFEERIALPGQGNLTLPSTFIASVAADYPARPIFQPFADKARASGWTVAEVDAGHDSHVERPNEVANILLAAA